MDIGTVDVGTAILVGAIVSGIVQYIKNKFHMDKQGTLSAVVLLSIVGGIGYYIVVKADFVPAALQILGFAGAIYTFIIKRFEEAEEE